LAANPALAGEVFNFSYEHPVTVLELASRILSVMESDLQPDVRNEASNEIRHQYLDASKARTMLGWTPAFTVDAGLRETIDWYRMYFASARDPEPERARG
jgi:CDP-glucose 4,6-dehydratase